MLPGAMGVRTGFFALGADPFPLQEEFAELSFEGPRPFLAVGHFAKSQNLKNNFFGEKYFCRKLRKTLQITLDFQYKVQQANNTNWYISTYLEYFCILYGLKLIKLQILTKFNSF